MQKQPSRGARKKGCFGVLKICSKFTVEHPCRSVISIKLQSNFIEITLWHGCFPVNLLHMFRTPFLRNTCRLMLLYMLALAIKYISEIVSHRIVNNAISLKCVTRPFRCIYVNCFNRLRYLAEVSIKLQKIPFFGQFKEHISGRKHEN